MAVSVIFDGDSSRLRSEAAIAERSVGRFAAKTDISIKSAATAFLSGAAAFNVLQSAVGAATDFDRLELGLRAVTDETVDLEGRIESLREAAKKPGLGFEEALRGATRLQAVGFSIETTDKILKEFSNAVATTGGGKAELDRITTQLGQLAAKGKVLSQDLRPIIEASPAVSKALKQAFGTTAAEDISKQVSGSSEFIEILLKQMEELPRVAGGAQNTFDNLQDASRQALAGLGKPIVEELLPIIEKLVADLEDSDSGIRKFGSGLGEVLGSLVKISPALFAFAKAYVAFKVAQKGLGLAKSLASTISRIQESVVANDRETVAIQRNTAALQRNASVRTNSAGQTRLNRRGRDAFKGFRKQGNSPAESKRLATVLGSFQTTVVSGAGKASRLFSKSFLKGVNARIPSGMKAVGILAAGQLSNSLLPESKFLGGSMGESLIDGLSGGLVFAGPVGLIAAGLLQGVKIAGQIGQKIADEYIAPVEKAVADVAKISITDQAFRDAAFAGDRQKALDNLIAKHRQFRDITKAGDEDAARIARQNIKLVESEIENLDRTIGLMAELRAETEKLAEARAKLAVEDRGKFSAKTLDEVALLKARLEGEEELIEILQRKAKEETLLARIRQESPDVSKDDAAELANNLLDLQERVRLKQEEEKRLIDEKVKAEKELVDQRGKTLAASERAVDAIVSQLSPQEQLLRLEKERAKLKEKFGTSDPLGLLRAGRSASQGGDSEGAEDLANAATRSVELEGKIKALRDRTREVEQSKILAGLEGQILEAKLAGDDAGVRSASDKLEILKRALQIEQATNFSREKSVDLAKQELAQIRQKEALDEKNRIGEERNDISNNLKVLRLEAAGEKEVAKALRDKIAIQERVDDLVSRKVLSEAQAVRLAKEELALKNKISESEERQSSSRRGRRRGIGKGTSLFNTRTDFNKGFDFSLFKPTAFAGRKNRGDQSLTKNIKFTAFNRERALKKEPDKTLNPLERVAESNEQILEVWKKIGVV